MKLLPYALASLLIIVACNGDDEAGLGLVDPDVPGVPEAAPIDSIHLDLLDLPWPNTSADYYISDFTAQLSGYIWGTCSDLNDRSRHLLFSYDMTSDNLELVAAPPDLGLPVINNIEGARDGKLYLHSSGYLSKEVAIYDTRHGSWSTAEVPGLVKGMAVDHKDNTLWVAHGEGVSHVSDDGVTSYDDGNSALERIQSGTNYSFFGHAIAVDSVGTIWYANNSTLYFFADDEWSLHPLSPLSNEYIMEDIVAAPNGGVVAKPYEESPLELTRETTIRMPVGDAGSATPSISTIGIAVRAFDNHLFYAGFNSIAFYSPIRDSISYIDSSNSLLPENNFPDRLSTDPNGDVWLGGRKTLVKLPRDL